jgi:hypothetical protein
MKNAVFWDVTECGSCKNKRFGGKHRIHHQGDKNRCVRNNVIIFLLSALRFLVTANVVPSAPILLTLMMEAICSSET